MNSRLTKAISSIEASPEIEKLVPNTRLRLTHTWKAQVLSVARTEGQKVENRIHAKVSDTCGRFADLWRYVMQKEGNYRRWAESGVAQIEEVASTFP